MFNLDELLRPHIKALKPYASARDEYEGSDGIFLDANENPYGSVTSEKYNRYPDPHQRELKKRIGKIKNVPTNQIFLGNGSDEAIDLIYRLFCVPGKDNAIILPPTYGMYEVSAELNEVRLKKIPLTEDFQINTEGVLNAIDEHTKIIWFCTPNNPTANDVDPKAIKSVMERFRGIVVVDEAYIDFTDNPSFTTMLDQYPNLIVLQTFSKAWGLAGLRLGMAFASKEIIHYLDKIKAPYNINLLTQKLVEESLISTVWKDNVVKRTIKSKEKLSERLEQISGVKKIYPSSANFLLVKIDKAKDLYHFLVNNKIIVRDRSSVKLCEDCLRISVGTEEENEALVEAIKKFNK
jgi:histidinol-phosphate aminotransferase